MDVDAATEADDHTPWTAVTEPVASEIFGSADSIAYARTRGTPFGPIRFNASMARFVLATQATPSADAVALVSLQRRNVPLSSDHHAYASPGPLGFDKPSNALFLPPEFSSLNCYMCFGRFSGPSPILYINGSTGVPIVEAGSLETIEVSGSTQCWSDIWTYNHDGGGWQLESQPGGVTTHYFNFGDGNSTWGGSGSSVNATTYAVHYQPGVYTVSTEITCDCNYGGGFVWDVTGAQRDVEVQAPPPPPLIPIVIRLTFDDGPHVGGANNTLKVYDALQTNPVQSNIPATFFVQTHVSYRGGSPAGAAVMLDALNRGHNVMIHTGSPSDHTFHTARVEQAAYAGGNNALESDLILAKARIASLPGPVPTYVRPPGGARNPAVLASYSATQLDMKLWDVPTGDDVMGATFSSISTTLTQNLTSAILGGDSDIVILFHDIHAHTADNLGTANGYIKLIQDVCATLGRTPVFLKL
jgi:peptidoglycan/xylan/chitin deacetylase (PgdA/CDA1 family)